MDSVVSHIQLTDPDFNLQNYTCLITLYEDGSSFIPYHSDNEHSIVEGSNIYTLSIGETRRLIFRNDSDNSKKYYELKSGSINCMSQISQRFWQHTVPTSQTTEPRVSLTFRRLSAVDPVSKTDSDTKSKANILFLTDSIHKRFDSNAFPLGYNCSKKMNYRLENLSVFEKEFHNYDLVIISCGVNDIARHGHTVDSLMSLMSPKLRSYCMQNPSTTFVFNSILLTTTYLLNQGIDMINQAMFNLSGDFKNFWFLDSHESIVQSGILPIDMNDNGIHINIQAKRYLQRVLKDCILNFVWDINDPPPSPPCTWPLRSSYKHIAEHRADLRLQRPHARR